MQQKKKKEKKKKILKRLDLITFPEIKISERSRKLFAGFNFEKKKKKLYKKRKKIYKNYLYKFKEINKFIFLSKPKINEKFYPFFLNIKLIKESI